MHLGIKNGPFLPEGPIEVTRRGRRRKQLSDDFKGKRRYWKLKEKALFGTVWRTRFGRGSGRVVSDRAQINDDCTHSATVVRRTLWRCIDSGDKLGFCAAGNFGVQIVIDVCGVGCTDWRCMRG